MTAHVHTFLGCVSSHGGWSTEPDLTAASPTATSSTVLDHDLDSRRGNVQFRVLERPHLVVGQLQAEGRVGAIGTPQALRSVWVCTGKIYSSSTDTDPRAPLSRFLGY